MAKTSVADWDTTPANNLDLNSISLAENVMRPPAVNNAFREMMAQIKAGVPYLSGTTIILPSGASGGLQVSAAQLLSTDAGATIGPVLDLYRNSATPAGSDILGAVEFNGKDSGAAKQTYARVSAGISSATGGAELGTLTLSVVELGTVADYIVANGSTGVAINRPLDISNAAAGQIKFPATQVPAANANTLDDYEEGTWTPSLAPASGSITSSTNSGTYVKIGQVVLITFDISITNAGTGAGQLNITTFPITAAGNSYSGAVRDGLSGALCAIISGGSSGFAIRRYDNNTVIATGARFLGSFTHQAST